MNKFFSPVMFLFLLVGTIRSLPLDVDNKVEQEDNKIIITETNPSPSESLIDLSGFSGLIYGNPDSKIGEIVSNWSPENSVNPEELGSYVEGDILIPHGPGRNGLVSQSSRWPGGVVPYVIQGSFNAFEMDLIERGIKEYHAKTCLRFKPRTNERDYVAIVNGASGCWSSVGRVGGRQEVNLQTPACLSKIGTFIHEMMHAVGFFHEQNRSDRDNHVTVKYENIVAGTTANFDKTSSNKAHAFGVPYDYGSVMHYSAYAFSRNGNPTIIPRQTNGRNKMGQRDGFSANDVQKINKMYNCRGTYAASASGEGSASGSTSSSSENPGPGSTTQPSRPTFPGFNIPNIPILPIFTNILGALTGGLSGILGDEHGNLTKIAVIEMEGNEIGQENMLL